MAMEPDFKFAFNSSNFSDRVLHIEIVGEIEKGDGHEHSNDSSCSMDSSPVASAKSIHINSAILAAKSPFFYKLFSNGMQESDQRQATLRVDYSEEAALMELLGFMYSGKLTTTSAPLLFGVLMAADKFEVASCLNHCSRILGDLPIDSETALLFLELPSSVSMAAKLDYETTRAREFFTVKYRNLSKSQEEVMSLPLAVIEAILSSNKLEVESEDEVYDFVLKLARARYPLLNERREVLCSRLLRLVRFRFMSCRKLREALECEVLGCRVASDAVSEAFFFETGAPPSQSAALASQNSHDSTVPRWTYKFCPVKIVTFNLPKPQGVVSLELKWFVCWRLPSSGWVASRSFQLGKQCFYLYAYRKKDPQGSVDHFGLFLRSLKKGSAEFEVSYEFAVMTKRSNKFVTKHKGSHTSKGGFEVGSSNLFGMKWNTFLSSKSPYFIDGTLHLRAELTINEQSG